MRFESRTSDGTGTGASALFATDAVKSSVAPGPAAAPPSSPAPGPSALGPSAPGPAARGPRDGAAQGRSQGELLNWMPAASSPSVLSSSAAQDAAAALARRESALGDSLWVQGLFQAALQRHAEAVRLRPTEPKYHYKAACAAWKSQRLDLVEPHFREAIRLDPRNALAHDGLGQWCLETGQIERALEHSAAAVALDGGRTAFVISRAGALAAAGQDKAAWDLIHPLTADDYRSCNGDGAALAVLHARLAPKFGQEAQAVSALERVARSPDLSPAERPQVHFAAAALLDRMERYDEAFGHARVANDASRRPYDPAAFSERVSHQIRYFTPRRLASLPRATHGSRRPVLVVGMPRSGTSLVEQILASHPAVFGAGELETLGRIGGSMSNADWAAGESHPECLESLSVRRANKHAAEYLEAITALNTDANYVTDKMPANCHWLDVAELLLPDCHVIHCVRDPLDTCLSCYFTDFATGNDFSTDLGHLGAYARDYRRLMEHWKRVLSLSILDVRYEDLVLDAPGQVRRMLDFLDLPWDGRCLKFHENQRLVKTASKDQVRRPIYSVHRPVETV